MTASGRSVASRYCLALRRGELQPAADGVEQGDLPADDVRPVRGVRVLQVGQPHLRAGVQRVDRHLRLRRPGDLHPPIDEIGGRRAPPPSPPRRTCSVSGRKSSRPVRAASRASLGAAGQQLVPAVPESPLQLGDEGQRVVGQDVAIPGDRRAPDLDGGVVGAGVTHRFLLCTRPQGASPAPLELPDRGRDSRRDGGVEDAGHDVAGVQFLRGHRIGDGLGGGDQHLLGDVRGAGVQQPAEEPREGQHVVDLVGEIAPPGGNHRGVFPGRQWVDLGHRIGQREYDGIGCHGGDVGALQQVRRRYADEHVGTLEYIGQGSGEIVRVGVLLQPPAHVVPRHAARVHRAVPVAADDVPGALRLQQLDDGGAGGANPGHHDPHLRTRDFPVTRSAFRRAAATTIAVPCWSS